jgi:hypothetical protein
MLKELGVGRRGDGFDHKFLEMAETGNLAK